VFTKEGICESVMWRMFCLLRVRENVMFLEFCKGLINEEKLVKIYAKQGSQICELYENLLSFLKELC
jgi:hypothetical protein